MKANQPPGVSDIRLLNFFLALALWLGAAGWLWLLRSLAGPASTKHLIEKHPAGMADFWVLLSRNPQPYLGLCVFVGLMLGWLLVVYLGKAGLRSGWVLPLLSVAVHLTAAATVLTLLAPVLVR